MSLLRASTVSGQPSMSGTEGRNRAPHAACAVRLFLRVPLFSAATAREPFPPRLFLLQSQASGTPVGRITRASVLIYAPIFLGSLREGPAGASAGDLPALSADDLSRFPRTPIALSHPYAAVNATANTTDDAVFALLGAAFTWDTVLANALPGFLNGLDCHLQSGPSGRNSTLRIVGSQVRRAHANGRVQTKTEASAPCVQTRDPPTVSAAAWVVFL